MYKRQLHDLKHVALFYDSAVKHLRENALPGHDAVSHLLENRASLVAFLPDLCQLQNHVITDELRPDGQRRCV